MPAGRDVVARQQGAPDRGLDAQHREVAAGDRLGRHHADPAALVAVHRHRHELGGGDVAEDLGGAVAHVLEVGVGERAELERRLVEIEVDHLLRPLYWRAGRMTALTRLKMAVLAPMPRASERTATAVNAGRRASDRTPSRTSRPRSLVSCRIPLPSPPGSDRRRT